MQLYFFRKLSDTETTRSFFADLLGLSEYSDSEVVAQQIFSKVRECHLYPVSDGQASPDDFLVDMDLLKEYGNFLNRILFSPEEITEKVTEDYSYSAEITLDEVRMLTISKASESIALYQDLFLSEENPERYLDPLIWLKALKTDLYQPC